MKKIFVLLALAFVLAACDNGDMEKGPVEPNPYPDGVSPFEVSNITHTEEDNTYDGYKYVITWDNPDDKDFRRIEYDVFAIMSGGDQLISGEYANVFFNSYDLGVNSLTAIIRVSTKKYLFIRCIDRFGNISAGVRHNLYDD